MDEIARVGRFETVRLLGRGGMGEVYLARDPLIDRLVAVKLLSGTFDDDARTRFSREARATGRLDHPHIVTIFDVGEHDGRPFIAMEYVPGVTVGGLIRQPAPPPQADLLRLVEDACAGLAFAHRAGVVHLDIKPENLIRREDGRLKILDFGIARMAAIDETQTRSVQGTLRYMSPEQLSGGPVDHRSDVFGLGCVLFEVITHQPAFGGSWSEVLARMTPSAPPRLLALAPAAAPALERIIARALAHDPAQRYDDLETLRGELAEVRRGLEPTLSDPVTIASLTTRVTPLAALLPNAPPHGRRGRVALAAGVVLVAGLGWGLWTRPPGSTSSTPDAPAPASGAKPAVPSPTVIAAPPAPVENTRDAASAALASSARDALAQRDRRAALARPRAQPDRSAPVAAERAAAEPRAPIPPPGRPGEILPSPPATRNAGPGTAQPAAPASTGGATEVPRPLPARADEAPARAATEPPLLSAAPVERAAPSPEVGVRAALAAYEAAYAQRDIGALTRVFPGLSAAQSQALARTFADAERYGLELRILGVTVSGASATATADVTHALVPKVGNASRNTVRSTFHLTPSGSAWLIARVDSTRR